MRKAVSLFAGAGGFCEGVRLAGFKVVCAVEDDADACRTHAANFKDVALFKGKILRNAADDDKYQMAVDIIRQIALTGCRRTDD